jgi:CheY-like chemotaxis protein
MSHQMGKFQIHEKMMRYDEFISSFYNLCLNYGFTPGKIMPSRAFCSDENQGYPIILIAKHFGAFPFDHGRVGGIVATGRHGPHAHHGKDLVIIQASHVGYDPVTDIFGVYRRIQTEEQNLAHSCGKICGVLDWYLQEYAFAQQNVSFIKIDDEELVVIDNQLLDIDREEGLFLHMEILIDIPDRGKPESRHVFSTSKAFKVNPNLQVYFKQNGLMDDKRVPIGKKLTEKMFHFERKIHKDHGKQNHLEYNLSFHMPHIVSSAYPALAAAQANTQIEFDRTYRSIIKEHEYEGKNLAFIAGINIDISPQEGQLFPLTKFVPWAAYIQTQNGNSVVLEQNDLVDMLLSQKAENAFQIDLEKAIRVMASRPSDVMLVDDEQDFVQTLSERLQERNVDAMVAYDGESALHMIQEHEPDVMFLDLNMPGISGAEVLQRIKKSNPHIKVIILTGHGDEEIRKTCLRVGAFAYLQKPFDIDQITNIISRANDSMVPQ